MKQVTITFADGSSNVLTVTPSSTVKFEWLTDRGPGLTAAHNEDSYALESVASIEVHEANLATTAAQQPVATHEPAPAAEPVPASTAEVAPVTTGTAAGSSTTVTFTDPNWSGTGSNDANANPAAAAPAEDAPPEPAAATDTPAADQVGDTHLADTPAADDAAPVADQTTGAQ